MIKTIKTFDKPNLIVNWLEKEIKSKLKSDVSNYAKGRLRVWLDVEPMLFAPFNTVPAFKIQEKITARLKEIIEWDYDFALVTYSGDDTPIGILPHRDAGYASFEARSIHLSGECKFDYWEGKEGLDNKSKRQFTIEKSDYSVTEEGILVPPTHSVLLKEGEITQFNCKDPHSATPSSKRWNINFWKKKRN